MYPVKDCTKQTIMTTTCSTDSNNITIVGTSLATGLLGPLYTA